MDSTHRSGSRGVRRASHGIAHALFAAVLLSAAGVPAEATGQEEFTPSKEITRLFEEKPFLELKKENPLRLGVNTWYKNCNPFLQNNDGAAYLRGVVARKLDLHMISLSGATQPYLSVTVRCDLFSRTQSGAWEQGAAATNSSPSPVLFVYVVEVNWYWDLKPGIYDAGRLARELSVPYVMNVRLERASDPPEVVVVSVPLSPRVLRNMQVPRQVRDTIRRKTDKALDRYLKANNL